MKGEPAGKSPTFNAAEKITQEKVNSINRGILVNFWLEARETSALHPDYRYASVLVQFLGIPSRAEAGTRPGPKAFNAIATLVFLIVGFCETPD